ncbi:hypothetical protein EDD18DRAFT_1352462 [Armillaria luteobubalina]|uniref:Uncharacterized protein n=1 Tax=Armillaria luteobubalina TaxID=153913 RepID=A0AA39Q5Y4_9AGAR|nr:hypothetical protein EDD18DRAFT_1352462 [Armillaria luteobubalina]
MAMVIQPSREGGILRMVGPFSSFADLATNFSTGKLSVGPAEAKLATKPIKRLPLGGLDVLSVVQGQNTTLFLVRLSDKMTIPSPPPSEPLNHPTASLFLVPDDSGSVFREEVWPPPRDPSGHYREPSILEGSLQRYHARTWRDACRPLYHCRCKICERGIPAEGVVQISSEDAAQPVTTAVEIRLPSPEVNEAEADDEDLDYDSYYDEEFYSEEQDEAWSPSVDRKS